MTAVSWGKWCVSFSTGYGIDGARLTVFVPYDLTPNGTEPPGAVVRCKTRYGEGNGLEFDSVEEAKAYALERGYLQEVRREHDAWYERQREWTRQLRREKGLPVG